MEIKRRENKNKIPKLITELIFFRLLYLDFFYNSSGNDSNILKNDRGSDSKTEVTLREIRLFTDVSNRTLSRYARELVDCGAVKELNFRVTDEVFVASFGERKAPLKKSTRNGNEHMRRLARTTLLMVHFINNSEELTIDDYEGNYRYKFFFSSEEVEKWYSKNFPYSNVSFRTMQRDMQMVRQALYENEKIEMEKLYRRRW